MKSLLALFFCVSSIFTAYAGSDHLILRNGQEFDVKLIQVTDEKIIYSNLSKGIQLQEEVLSKDVYMVYIEKQGNMYFTPEGERVTGESERADYKKKDVIYLVRGAEIAVDKVFVTAENIRYQVKGKKSGLAGLIGKESTSEGTFEKSEVFMIRYRNGMRDIITSIEAPAETEAKEDTVKADTVKAEKPEFAVVFHSVEKGETLEEISELYSVEIEQIIEWNDLSSKSRPRTVLPAGTQLMIYQPKK